jgi:hypothetical protein
VSNNICFRFLVIVFIFFLTIDWGFAKDYEVGGIRYFGSFNFEENVDSDQNSEVNDQDPIMIEHELDQTLDKVIQENRIASSLTKASFFSLPIGISSDNNSSYMIVIDEATIYDEYATFSAFMILTNPLDGTKIRFRANDIAFTFNGGLVNGMKLELLDARRSKIMKDTYLNWLPGCFVEWDCNGFKSLGINGSIELSEKSYVEVNPMNGKEIGAVEAPFFINATDFQDFIVEFSLPTFKKRGFDEAYFSLTKVVLDYSDVHNAPGFSLPGNYPNSFSSEMRNCWQGIYALDARVILSNKFKDKNGQLTSFYASNLILDDLGLTGVFGVDNLISLENGRLGTWPMSISNFELEFFTGDFKSFDFEGAVVVEGSKTEVKYDAFFDSEGIYHFGINPGKELKFDVFAAEVNLNENSRIEVTVNHGKFQPTAILNGKISFSCTKTPGSEREILKLPGLDFQGMRISTVAPAFDLEYMGMASEENMEFNQFPITITDALFRKNTNNEARFTFGINVNLSKDESIVGATRVGIKTDLNKGNWKYRGLAIEMLTVKASKKGGYDIKGSIEFADGDPIYGDGFRGEVMAKFSESFELKAVAVFGKVNGFRYFFVDGFVCLPPPGITAGPFVLQGFGGGLYSRMRQALPDENSGSMGESLSGITYIPDKSSFLGIKAGIKAGVINEKIVNCKVNFEVIFNNHGGINQIGFFGEAKVMSVMDNLPIDEMKQIAQDAAVGKNQIVETDEVMKATVSILQDFQRNIFHSEMELFVNVAGKLTGIGANNRAGWGVMHIEPGKWYLHMGTPTDPVGLNFIGFMKVGGYFMAGHDIPDTMVMNPKVMEYLDIDPAKLNGNRQEGQLVAGKGLAFGAHFSLDTGDLKFLIFYASFELGGGFDLMLLDYGKYAYCMGRDGTLGINGWYAKGQAYAYFGGKIGIRVKVFGRRKKFDILDIRTAAAIRVEGPNPTFMWGIVGGKYRILGGLIKGRCKFEATVGEKCDIRTNPKDLSDMEIIADLSPANDSERVDVFTLPQAVFNMPVDKVLKISEDENLTKVFKINLKEYSVYQNNKKIDGQIEWNGENTTLAFTPGMIFYPNTKYKVVTKVSFEEKVNGRWQEYKDDSGKVYVESKEAEFTTGELPDKIPADFISHSYPVNKQANFYKQEYPKAYVIFKSDLTPFFASAEGWVKKAKWTTSDGAVIYTDLNYSAGSKTVESPVPNLLASKIYRYDLVNVPIEEGYDVNSNVVESTETKFAENENTAEITTREAEGAITNSEEISFYKADFRTSKFNKFLDKINTKELPVRFTYNVSPAVDLPGATIYGDEMFDVFEIYGKGKVEALVQRKAVLESANWYQANFHSLLYANYPFHSEATITNRNASELGIPPIKNIEFWQEYDKYSLSDADIESGQFNVRNSMTHFVYSLPITWAKDYVHVRNKLANLVAKGLKRTDQVNAILGRYPWPQVSAGNYPIKLQYVLPGKNIITSSQVVNLKNKFETNQVNIYSE